MAKIGNETNQFLRIIKIRMEAELLRRQRYAEVVKSEKFPENAKAWEEAFKFVREEIGALAAGLERNEL